MLDEWCSIFRCFFFSLDKIAVSAKTDSLDLNEIKDLVDNVRKEYVVKHPSTKAILAEYKADLSKNLEFSSLHNLAKHLKGDRQVIRDYLKGNKSGYYRGVWKFLYKN